jgi:Zn-dependent peptidase ImmA (M78 family)
METTAPDLGFLCNKDKATILRFQKTAPVNIVAVGEAFGLKVYEDELPNNISGKIRKDNRFGGTACFSIIVNTHEPTVRKRFTIAHEISHYLLHREQIGDELTDDALYRSGLSTLAEVRANKLAAEILMPYSLIEEALNKGAKTINELASALQVSKQAMRVRLEIPS